MRWRQYGKVDVMIHTSPRTPNHGNNARFRTASAAVVAVASAALLGAASAASAGAATPSVPAIPGDVTQLSSQATTQLNAQLPRVELPEQAYQLAAQYNVVLPEFLRKAEPFASERAAVDKATVDHLTKQGHHRDAAAEAIAQEWADQAAAGKVTFTGNAGDGVTHLNEGSGNIYRLTAAETTERTAWLNRDVPVTATPQGKAFGVATATDGTTVYVAEYFLN